MFSLETQDSLGGVLVSCSRVHELGTESKEKCSPLSITKSLHISRFLEDVRSTNDHKRTLKR